MTRLSLKGCINIVSGNTFDTGGSSAQWRELLVLAKQALRKYTGGSLQGGVQSRGADDPATTLTTGLGRRWHDAFMPKYACAGANVASALPMVCVVCGSDGQGPFNFVERVRLWRQDLVCPAPVGESSLRILKVPDQVMACRADQLEDSWLRWLSEKLLQSPDANMERVRRELSIPPPAVVDARIDDYALQPDPAQWLEAFGRLWCALCENAGCTACLVVLSIRTRERANPSHPLLAGVNTTEGGFFGKENTTTPRSVGLLCDDIKEEDAGDWVEHVLQSPEGGALLDRIGIPRTTNRCRTVRNKLGTMFFDPNPRRYPWHAACGEIEDVLHNCAERSEA